MEEQGIDRKLDILLARTVVIENKVDEYCNILEEKLNPTQKEWLNNTDLEEEYNLTENVRMKLFHQKKLKKYKINGAKSKAYYRRSDIEELLSSGLIFPKSKRV